MNHESRDTDNISMDPADKPEANLGRQRVAAIRLRVLQALGRPAHLFRVAVTPLWGNKYRVNVVTGENAGSVLIPNSYFVTADDLGNILGSSPNIQKQY